MSLAPREGAIVAYTGDEFSGERLTVGDQGKVLSNGGSGCHVLWQTGERRGQITLTANCDLVSQGQTPGVHEGHIVSTAVRDAYDGHGNRGLLHLLEDEGHLAALVPVTEEALELVAANLRGDAAVQEVLAHLDEDEGEGFVSYAALTLLRDAFGEP